MDPCPGRSFRPSGTGNAGRSDPRTHQDLNRIDVVARSLQLLVPREKTDARAMPQDRSAARIPLWTTLFVDAEPCEHFEVTGMGGCGDF